MVVRYLKTFYRICTQRLNIPRKKFTNDVATTFLVSTLSLFLSFVNIVLLARWLGPGGKGALALALLAPQVLGLFMGMGLNIASVHFISSRQIDINRVLGNSMSFVSLMCLAGLIIATLATTTGLTDRLVPCISIWVLSLGFIIFPITLFRELFNGILQGMQHISYINVVRLINIALVVLLNCFFILVLNMGVVGAISAYFVSGMINVVLLTLLITRLGNSLKFLWEPVIIRRMISFGLRGHVGNVVHFFNYRLDMFLVNYFLNPAQLGIYTISARLAELLWILPKSVGFVIFPKAASTEEKRMNRFTPKVFRITLVITVLSALSLVVASRQFIDIFLGYKFIGAFWPLLALLPGAIMLGSTKVLTSVISGRGYPQYNSISAGVGFIFTVVLDIYLIPRQGIMGAAIASSIAYSIVSLLSVFFYLLISKRPIKVMS